MLSFDQIFNNTLLIVKKLYKKILNIRQKFRFSNREFRKGVNEFNDSDFNAYTLSYSLYINN